MHCKWSQGVDRVCSATTGRINEADSIVHREAHPCNDPPAQQFVDNAHLMISKL
jgi:hypothetical protein